VAYVHGFGSRRTGEKANSLEAACASRGWPFVAADFRGHGDSSGTMLELRGSGLQADLETLWAWLQERGCPALYLVGSSMGAWASAWFALRRPELVRACVLLAPALDFLANRWEVLSAAERERWRQTGKLRFRNEWLDTELGYGLAEERAAFPLARLIAEWRTPALVIHGMRDDVVPPAGSIRFVEALQHREVGLHLFEEGDHRLSGYEAKVARLACDFLAER
jgi:pimeloyl-ACP methyl ester carboxylesterase